MPVTKTSVTLTAPISQSVLTDQIKTLLAALGFVLVEDYIATDRLLVFSIAFDAAKTFGTIFLRVRITAALSITQSIGTGWNTTTKAIANESPVSQAVGLSSTLTLELVSYSRGNEIKLIQLSQGTTTTPFLGTFRPESKPSWWDESAYPYAFFPYNSTGSYWLNIYSSALNPFGNNTYSIGLANGLNGANPVTGKRDIVAGLLLTTAAATGVAGRTSTDVSIVAAANLTKLDVIQVSETEEYTLLSPGSNGVALRTK